MLKKLFTKMQRQIVSFRTVLILLWGASPQAIILLILASSLTGFLTPIGLLCTQHFLDAIVRSVSAGGKFASVVIWLLLLLGASCIIKTWMLKIENTSEYNKTTDWQVSKNLIEQRGIYNEV